MKSINVNARTKKRLQSLKLNTEIERYNEVIEYLCDCFDWMVDNNYQKELIELLKKYER